jgi:L-lactate dehydrogenase complex protein LldF
MSPRCFRGTGMTDAQAGAGPAPFSGHTPEPAVPFLRRVEKALADVQLHRALAIATDRLSSARTRAFEDLPDGEALRHTARLIRAHTVANLDRYLTQFADSAERLGCQLHWAETAADAARAVVAIAKERGITLAVKSKSMVTEEVELNHALEKAGVRVVETDLGEFVVQVAGDRPSHIITPIIHKRREDVAALFKEKLGARDEEVADIPAITAFARRILRREFLNSGIGISGANFAVAESGSLCVVTNEGNGRLTTTVPRVHVALVGLERLLPTIADLGVMMQLIARSATGQAAPVYTNVISGPRRRGGARAPASSGDPDGPDELHIVIVDNGRSRILGSDLAEILYCIRCGACLNICPVYQQIGGHAYGGVYPGPVGSVVSPGLYGLEAWGDLPHASTLCGACRDVCPVCIDLPHLLLELRARGNREGLDPLWLKIGMAVFSAVATRPALYRAAGNLAGRLCQLVAREGWISRLPGPLGAWTIARDFPAPATRSFTRRWHDAHRRPTEGT